ncbi:ATP-binding protein [Candidatus Margulisiibacteriota bacterium]
MRIPFFAKLLLLFMLLSVIPIAGAGLLLFMTFKEIIDLYIYKPLLWNLKTSKEEFLVALGNVQVQALFLIMLAIILVVIVSSIASRAIAQSLRRIGYGMKKLEEGELSYKIARESNDEIGDLADYFNKMAAEIKRSREIMENWNKELEKTVEERTKNLRTLYNLSKAIGSTLNLDELLTKSIAHIPQIPGTKYLSIFVKDEKGNFVSRITNGLTQPYSFKAKEGMFGETIAGEQIVKTADIKEASSKEKEMLRSLELKNLLLIPMERKGEKTGLIVIGTQKDYIPSDIELNLLSTIADQMAIGIENANVYEKEKEAVKKLIGIDKMKTELISMVSHELRTPLTSIKGFLAHFISGTAGPMNDTQMKFAKIMSHEGDHLLELIDTLLEFSKVERGVFEVKKSPVQIDKLMTGISEALRPQLDAKGIKLTLSLKAGKAKFGGDEAKVGQVLRNLIGNAVKFVKENPKIDISSKVLPDNKIEVRVKDNGVGIDKDHLGKIFNKFYQVDTSLTRKIGGLGLGLAISKEIIDAHGGNLSAESEGTGKGSTFIFTLPMLK